MQILLKQLSISLAILLLAAWPACASEKISDQVLSSVLQQIEDKGETVVLVELSSPKTQLNINTDITNITDVARRRTVAEVQQRFQSLLSFADQQRISHQYQYVPGVAIRVDQESLKKLEKNPLIKAIYENSMRKATLSQSIELVFKNQVGSRYTGNNEWAVAVLDSGVDKSHSFLKTGSTEKVISEACYSGGKISKLYSNLFSLCPGGVYSTTASNSGKNCTGFNGCDHGTHVAGIAAGDGTSSDGVARLGKIIAVQVFTGYISTIGTYEIGAFDADILSGLERIYTLRNSYKIAAVNMSLGSGSYSSSCNGVNNLITNIIASLKNVGIATVVSSGNDSYANTIGYPACISNAIAVGATYDSGTNIDKSTTYSNESGMLDLYAPGSYITSSVPGGSFDTWEGTSMASPHVAGSWAVLKHANPKGSVDEFENLLKTLGPNVKSRNGKWTRKRLDVYEALQYYNKVNITPILPVLLKKDL